MENKILIKRCRYCRKEITSMYKKQLDYNVQAHELSCKKKIMEETQNNLNKKEDTQNDNK